MILKMLRRFARGLCWSFSPYSDTRVLRRRGSSLVERAVAAQAGGSTVLLKPPWLIHLRLKLAETGVPSCISDVFNLKYVTF